MKFRFPPFFYHLAAGLLILVATVRIVSTYSVFNQTIDEPCHVASGMERLVKGTYVYDTEDPVLSRIAIAAGPYLFDGARPTGQPNCLFEGNEILYGGGNYFRRLSLARAGILPFFILASAVLWCWCRRLFGDAAALVSVFLFTTAPPVLAHAGLATTDMAGCACLLAALYSFARWLEAPSPRMNLVLGLCAGLAVLAKFSALLFLPLCMIAIVVLFAMSQRPSAAQMLRRVPGLGLAAVVAFLLIWAAYRFSYGVMPNHELFASQPQVTIARFLGPVSLPAPEFFDGIATVQLHNFLGHPAWCLGKYSPVGFWYYFPVALTVKTPIAFLGLTLLGLGIIYRQPRTRPFAWQPWVPVVCSVLVLASVIPAHINIGVRHVLILYPLLSMAAGLAAVTLLRQGSKAAVLAAVALLCWQAVASFRTHPDHLSYFNELVTGDPAQVLSDSDLDWGQDLQRLSDKLRQVGAREVTLIYFGNAAIDKHGLPPVKAPHLYERQSGWIAVSAFIRTVGRARIELQEHRSDTPLAWLDSERPVAHIGKSIDLYYIPPD